MKLNSWVQNTLKMAEFDVIEILKDFNINAVRLRLWYDPYDENNRPYGGGTNDLPVTIKIAERAKSKNMQFLLDFHYSDFWQILKFRKSLRPGKICPEKLWKRRYTIIRLKQ